MRAVKALVAAVRRPAWEGAEAIAAECASAIGFPEGGDMEPGIWKGSGRVGQSASREHGLRHRLWPRLRWEAPREKPSRVAQLAQGAESCTPRAGTCDALAPEPLRGPLERPCRGSTPS